MAEETVFGPLARWSLGAFHAALLVLVLVLAVYRLGNLAVTLGNASTALGLALYLALWAISWWGAMRALDSLGARPTVGTILGRGALWGGGAGAVFFASLFLAVILITTVAQGLPPAGAGFILFSLLETILGSLLAFAVGAVIGTLLAMLDSILLILAFSLSVSEKT